MLNIICRGIALVSAASTLFLYYVRLTQPIDLVIEPPMQLMIELTIFSSQDFPYHSHNRFGGAALI
jgi:hypothetical protein